MSLDRRAFVLTGLAAASGFARAGSVLPSERDERSTKLVQLGVQLPQMIVLVRHNWMNDSGVRGS